MTTRISTHIAIVLAVAVAAAVVSSAASADPSKGTHITIPPTLASSASQARPATSRRRPG